LSYTSSKNTFENYYLSIFKTTKHSLKHKMSSICPFYSNMYLPCFHSGQYIWGKKKTLSSSKAEHRYLL